MYLVIMGHTNCNFLGIDYFYGVFYVPMFFLISGFLEKEQDLKDTIIHGIRTLIIPFILLYLIYSITFVIAGIIIKPEIFNKPLSIIKPFLGIFIGENGFTTKYAFFVCGPLWFVLALFWIKIIDCVFGIICKNNTVYYSFLVFLMPFIILVLEYFEINLPLSFDSATLSFPFFAIGKMSKKYSVMKEKDGKFNYRYNFIYSIVIYIQN
jgi:fucose 4-O-acetylase-like acetyltransferase